MRNENQSTEGKMKVSKMIAGIEVSLTQGVSYYADCPMAERGRLYYPVTIRSCNDQSVGKLKLTEEQERQVAEYRERIWGQATPTEPVEPVLSETLVIDGLDFVHACEFVDEFNGLPVIGHTGVGLSFQVVLVYRRIW